MAEAHLQAAIRPQTDGKRYILAQNGLYLTQIADLLKNKYGNKYGTKNNRVSYCLLKMASWFDEEAATMLPYYGQMVKCNSTASERDLGIKYRN